MNMRSLVVTLVAVVAGLTPLALAQNITDGLDPVKDYCVRINHQSTIKNNVLYIDGGIQTFSKKNSGGNPDGGAITTGYNDYLIAVNMSMSWDWNSNLTQTVMPKTANPQTGTYPPTTVRGALFPGADGDNNIYLYGGTTSYINTSFVGFRSTTSSQYSLWSFDTVMKQWNQWDVTDTSPYRPNAGASAEAPDQGLAFYFNGQIDNGSSISTQGIQDSAQIFLEGMVVINTTDQTARNLSTAAVSGDNPRTRGALQYLPGIGESGILAYLGGSYKSVDDVNDEEIGTLVPFDTIDIFDVASSKNSNGTWYRQTTTGTVPPARVDHCVVAASAPDNSSHNIYVYGGRSSATTIYDNIYVLSIPSFHWTKVYGDGASPRYGMTCHLVAERELITVGGWSSANVSSWCDWESKGVAILDISTMKWGSVYNATPSAYTVPQSVVNDIGGSIYGGATFTRPSADWDNADLAKLFGASLLSANATGSSNTTTSPTPSSVPASSAMSAGAIAGLVIGIVVALLLLFGVIWFFVRRREQGPKPKKERHQIFETDGEQYFEKDASYKPMPPKKDPPSELPSPEEQLREKTFFNRHSGQQRVAELGQGTEAASELP